MTTPVDYIAAATAIADGAAPVETPASTAGGEVETPAEARSVPTETASPPAVEAKEEPPAEPKEPAKPVSRIDKGFEDLAREKAAFRAEREKFKAESTPLATFAEAAKRGDALALLAAAGISWKAAAEQVLASKQLPEQTERPDPRDQRLAALEREIAVRKEQEGRANIMAETSALVKANTTKFKHIAALGVEHEALDYIEKYYRETNELPGENLEESLTIALEAVEATHAMMAKRYAPLLTATSGPNTVSGSKTEVPAVGAASRQAAKTLTNNVGAGPRPAATTPTKPMSDADYQRAAIEALTTA